MNPMKTMLYSIALALSLSTPLVAGGVHDEIASYSDPEKKVFFKKYLNASNKTCGKVRKTFYKGVDKDKTNYWAVDCGGKNSYMISIKSDSKGSTRILECSILKTIGVDCWKKF